MSLVNSKDDEELSIEEMFMEALKEQAISTQEQAINTLVAGLFGATSPTKSGRGSESSTTGVRG